MRHFSADEVNAARAAHAGPCYVVEVFNRREALLITVPATADSAQRLVTIAPGQTIELHMLDGASVNRDPIKAEERGNA